MNTEHIPDSRRPSDPIFSMDAKAATEALQAKHQAYLASERPGYDIAKPATSEQARNRLDALTSDPVWRNRFEAHDSVARAEFHALTNLSAEGGSVAHALAGIVPPGGIHTGPGADLAQMADAVPFFRELGIGDGIISELLSDKPSSPLEARLAREWRDRHLKDEAWVKRWNSGDPVARREMVLCSMVIAAGPEL